jgi:ribose transport system ATP-binding protein
LGFKKFPNDGKGEVKLSVGIILRADKINKSFPGVKALSDVCFNLRKGEVHVLIGENGAGKSTLMKIFSGLYSVDTGSIYMEDRKVEIKSTKHSQELGIAIIYQEFNLIPELSVGRNIFLGREPKDKFGNIDKKKIHQDSQDLLDFLHSGISAKTIVKNLGVAQQQLVEIAKALSQNARILIMDEPTASLSENEIETLFKVIRSLKEREVSIIYISHRLQELRVIGDRVTVLRDGQTITTKDIKDIELDEIIRLMVGREVSRERVRTKNTAQNEVAIDVRNINQGKTLKNVSLKVHKGEIVALAGLVGAGRTELAHAIYGIDPVDSGEVFVHGKKVERHTPHNNVRRGIGLLPESRKENGLSLILPMTHNITQAALEKISGAITISLRKERNISAQFIKKLNIACPGSYQLPLYLSGGNQQKVVIAKWLFTQSSILIFDEPTRGIDVGARNEIYHIIDGLAKQGVSILIISSDLPEIMTIADRIYVMKEGTIVADIPYEESSQEMVISYATGGRLE